MNPRFIALHLFVGAWVALLALHYSVPLVILLAAWTVIFILFEWVIP